MSGNAGLLVVIGVLVACGVYLILERRVSKMLLGMILVGNAVNLLILVIGGPAGRPPIVGQRSHTDRAMTDPLAQAMILTAIVITMGLAGFVLALAYRSFMLTSRDDVENDPEDIRVVAKRDSAEPAEPTEDPTDAGTSADPEEADDTAGYTADDAEPVDDANPETTGTKQDRTAQAEEIENTDWDAVRAAAGDLSAAEPTEHADPEPGREQSENPLPTDKADRGTPEGPPPAEHTGEVSG